MFLVDFLFEGEFFWDFTEFAVFSLFSGCSVLEFAAYGISGFASLRGFDIWVRIGAFGWYKLG